MSAKKTTFALFFGNRGSFPASLQVSAREDMTAALKKLGHKTIALPASATRNGAVETPTEGKIYAKFLEKNRGKFEGVILCLPNFGDETGAIAALKHCGVPILVQAYPDELDKMAPALRRDAFCGKFSVMDVFYQNDLPFTALEPHTVAPQSDDFTENIKYFDSLCRVVGGMTEMTIGSIGARTTAFKTVRYDELAMQRYGITIETLDLSDIFARMKALKPSDKKLKAKIANLMKVSTWKGVPAKAQQQIARLGVAMDQVIDEYKMDGLALRCWMELQMQMGISPCVLMGMLNNKMLAAACEVDVCNAVTMRALTLASGKPPTCLDWNNNYGKEKDKCILFHCGPVPEGLMKGKGQITDHAIIANVIGKGKSFGCNVGRIKPMDMTYGSMITEDGELSFYIGEGKITDDPIPADYFGCAGVAEIENLQSKLRAIGQMGHRHHTSLTQGHVAEPVCEAFEKYLGYNVTMF